MGMFDTLVIADDFGLFDECAPRHFQTKSLECDMVEYVLRGDNKLYNSKGEQVNIDGFLNFYAYDEDEIWYEFVAWMQDGLLIDIMRV